MKAAAVVVVVAVILALWVLGRQVTIIEHRSPPLPDLPPAHQQSIPLP